MNPPVLFQLTRGATQPTSSGNFYGPIKYRIFDCLQKNDENLVPMSQSARHRFAVMYRKGFSHDLMAVLKRAYRIGGISPLKLIDVSENSLYIFLDAKVASSTVAAIEATWLKLPRSGRYGHWKVHFASESEIWSGHSDYDFLSAAKEVLESHELGIMDATVPTPNVVNFKDFWGYASEKQPSLGRQVHAPLPTTVVSYLHSAAQFISYLQKREITEGDFSPSECTKKQLHLLKIALQFATGLRLPGEPVHRSPAVCPLCKSSGDDSLLKKKEVSMGHKSASFTSIYALPRTSVGGCRNTFSSKYMDVDNLYLHRIEKLVAKPFLRQKKADRT
jgi:hypothetical protein